MAPIGRIIAGLGLSIVTSLTAAAEPGQAPVATPKVQTRITISPETTRVAEPLRADGYVDYLAALNRQHSQDVTPDNNSAVLMIRAMGPTVISKGNRAQYIQMLGIPPLAEAGSYFVKYGEYTERARKASAPDKESTDEDRQKSWEELNRAMSRPWLKAELPTVAAWLYANEPFLTLIVEASKRPRRYDPLIATGDPPLLIAVKLPVAHHRDAARALVARAMFQLGDGRVEDAWQDLLACRRLGRLVGQGGTLVDMLVAKAIDGVAGAADRAVLAHVDLTAAQARQMHLDLQKLPPLPKTSDVIDVAERYMYLDCVQTLADKGISQISHIAGGTTGEAGALEKLLSDAAAATIDWDLILRMGNSWYDRFVAALRKPTRAERSAEMKQLEDEIKNLAANTRDFKSLALSMLAGPRRAVSERVGEVLIALLLPALNAAAQAEERGSADFEVVQLGLLLAAYRAENGKYPDQLTDLTPQYLAEIPPDRFSDRPLIYKPQAGGYLLYSVGVNGKDDGGLSYDDRAHALEPGADYDDLTIRIPSKQQE